MVSARTVSTVLALSCVAAPLLQAACSQDQSIVAGVSEQDAKHTLFSEDMVESSTMEENVVETDEAVEEAVQEDDEASLSEFSDNENAEALGKSETGNFDAQQQPGSAFVAVTDEPEDVMQPEEDQQEVPAEKTPETVVGAEEEHDKQEQEAPMGFFDRIKRSLSRGFSSLKGKFSNSHETGTPKEQLVEKEAAKE